MNITFREYKEEDKDTLISLANKLEEYQKNIDPIKRVVNKPGFAKLSIKETLENVAKYQGKILLAEDAEKVVGYVVGVIWKQSEMNKLEIGPHILGGVLDLYVDDQYRGQGLGTKMLTMIEEYFKQKGCDGIWIDVFAPNENAHKLYKKYGFIDREIGMLKNI